MATSISAAFKAVDYFHRIRNKPKGWVFSGVGLAAICVVVWVGPKVMAMAATITKLDERTARVEKAVDRIEGALIARGVMADSRPRPLTDTDVDAAVHASNSFRGFIPSASAADDGMVGAGVPRGVPAAVPAADRDRVVKEAR